MGHETNETFEVMLDNPGGGASLGTRNVATVTITDNDTAGEIKFAAAAVSVGEASGEAASVALPSPFQQRR